MNYDEFFRSATGFAPYPYQRRLAERASDYLKVETGLGKTEALVLGWEWRRRRGDAVGRRLVYVLPMRSLVEQTAARLQACADRLAQAGIADFPRIDVAIGGDVGERWYEEPEAPAIIIGTQDMLLSRGLNRGYAMSRFRWPMAFAALNNDSYWVLDEVQLQGIGAVTASQLQAFRDRFGFFGATGSTFASATLDTAWFETADVSTIDKSTETLTDEDLAIDTVRQVAFAPKRLERLAAADVAQIARAISEQHRAGTLTLAVVNTVRAAKELYSRLQRERLESRLLLLHSQFRSGDRRLHMEALKEKIDPEGPGMIVVATQVVEAGVDISAATLFTDVAPWASLVQRFGRCNRRGDIDDARVVWLDRGEVSKTMAPPYAVDEMAHARELLLELEGQDMAPKHLRDEHIPRGGGLVLRVVDLIDLFDTSTDLSGKDVDVAAYIRDGEEFNASVFWRDAPPGPGDPPRPEELCPAPLGQLRELLKEMRANGHGKNVRIANQFAPGDEEWIPLVDDEIRPGLQVWLNCDVGWYDAGTGFGKSDRRVDPVEGAAPRWNDECCSIDGDRGSVSVAVTLANHLRNAREEARSLIAAVDLPHELGAVVETAALWHDVGKAHDVFQNTMRKYVHDHEGQLWAKSPRMGRHERPGFRHELPGALAYLEAHPAEPNASLIAYLIAAHHGKLRISAPVMPTDADKEPMVLGNCEGDRVPEVELPDGTRAPAIAVSLAPFRVGTADGMTTWVELSTTLRDDAELGPFRLAHLELLVRIADWRASRSEQEKVEA